MNYDGVANEILWYGEKSEDGRWIIPVSVDWDYTLTKCSSWESGEMILNDDAFEVMRRWSKEYNVGWILDTMRHDGIIQEPINILEKEGIKLYGVRRNPQQDGDDYAVPKIFAVMSIDDRNLGTPLKWLDGCNRPHVDWKKIDKIGTKILEKIVKKLNIYN